MIKLAKICLVGISGSEIDFLSAPYILLNYFNNKSRFNKEVESKVLSYKITAKNDPKFDEKCGKIYSDINNYFYETRCVKETLFACFSCYVWNINAVKYLSKRIKEKNQNIIILWGGPEISEEFIINGVFDSCPVDYLIYGEGESALMKLIDGLISKEKLNIDLINNVAMRIGDGFICSKGVGEQEDVFKNPSAVLSGCMDTVFSNSKIRVNIETQRGCNFRCAYCFYHKSFKGIRYRDSDVVINEILYVYKKGCSTIRITDANFVSSKKHALAIFEGLIKNNIKISIMIECLPQFIDEEIAKLFKKYVTMNSENKLMVGMGIQSLNEKSMKTIKRCVNKKHFENAFKLLKAKNIIIKSDIILGLPYETKQTFFEVIDFLVNLQRDGYNLACVGLLRILPGTDLVKIAEDLKIVYDKNDSEHYIYSTPLMPRVDVLECLRITTVVSRIISTKDIRLKVKLRNLYFEVKDTLQISNIALLHKLSYLFEKYLRDKNSDFVKPNFPNAEYYYCYKIDSDIPDREIKNMLLRLKNVD